MGNSKGQDEFSIYAISDATSDLSVNIAVAGIKQFSRENVQIIRKRHITTPDMVRNLVLEVSEKKGEGPDPKTRPPPSLLVASSRIPCDLGNLVVLLNVREVTSDVGW